MPSFSKFFYFPIIHQIKEHFPSSGVRHFRTVIPLCEHFCTHKDFTVDESFCPSLLSELHKILSLGYLLESCGKAILIDIDNIGFYGNILKIIPNLTT